MTTLYGIKNCDTIKKARKWLDTNKISYTFHDFRIDGIDKKMIQSWLKQVDWETLLNTRGTTWRKLPESERNDINKTRAVTLMLEQPAIIKRPVLETGKKIHIGFNDKNYSDIFK